MPVNRIITSQLLWVGVVVAALFAAPPLQGQSLQALRSDAFAQSVGINTHFSYLGTNAYAQFDLLRARLDELGIKHLRDGATIRPEFTGFWNKLNTLAGDGLRFSLVSGGDPVQPSEGGRSIPTQIDVQLADNALFRKLLKSGAVRYIEGWNEPGNFGGLTNAQKFEEVARSVDYQKKLFAAVRADADAAKVKILGPSYDQRDFAKAAGDLTAYVDAANMHDYAQDRFPESPGRGDFATIEGVTYGFGSTAYHTASARQYLSGNAKARPVVSTESGWSTFTGSTGISDYAQSVYVARQYLNHFANPNIESAYLYELIDEQNEPGARDRNWGILNYDGSPKPAFRALKGLLQVLDDPAAMNASFTPITLDLSISGGDSSLRQVLFEKADGTLVLAMWRAVAVGTSAAPASESLTLTLAFDTDRFEKAAALHRFATNGSLSTSAVMLGATGLNLSVGERVTLLELTALQTVPEPAMAVIALVVVVGVSMRRRSQMFRGSARR